MPRGRPREFLREFWSRLRLRGSSRRGSRERRGLARSGDPPTVEPPEPFRPYLAAPQRQPPVQAQLGPHSQVGVQGQPSFAAAWHWHVFLQPQSFWLFWFTESLLVCSGPFRRARNRPTRVGRRHYTGASEFEWSRRSSRALRYSWNLRGYKLLRRCQRGRTVASLLGKEPACGCLARGPVTAGIQRLPRTRTTPYR